MKKGTRHEATSRFLHAASDAGVSTRCTMIVGYPGEQGDDVHASADFLEAHVGVIERVSLNRLQVMTGTVLHRRLQAQPERFPGIRIVAQDHAMARVDHRNPSVETPQHRRAVSRLLAVVDRINRQPLRPRAREFEGVM